MNNGSDTAFCWGCLFPHDIASEKGTHTQKRAHVCVNISMSAWVGTPGWTKNHMSSHSSSKPTWLTLTTDCEYTRQTLSHTDLFQVALAPARLCWVPLSLLHSSASPPAVPPFSPPPPAWVFACERSVRLEDEPLPNLSLLWRLLEIQKDGREKP